MLILNSSIHYISNDNDASLQLYIVFNLWSFQWNKSLKSRYTSSDKPLAQPLVNAMEEVLNQRTVTPFWNESRCWNYVFQTAKDTLKGWNVDFNIWVESFCDFSQYTYISIKSKVELCRNWNVFWDFLGMLGLHTEWLNWVSLILKMGACLEIIWEIKWLVLKWYTRIWFIHTSSFRTYV